ncbi:hypothetical protein COY27_05285 [Candidatus Woesearchaeota archaeon CG_4_10_14_0_2_um_filter_33_13]|nr:MAG: hypothetical protein COY27_05285 [Candidatus Woesearchaeota archaeon CG_4_10_14_0_2_um_filter_33_13]
MVLGLSRRTIEDIIKPELRVVRLPDDSSSATIIRVKEQIRGGEYDWQSDKRSSKKDSLLVQGELAVRMLDFLRLYNGGGHDFARYVSDPDCHGAAMYAMGFVDYIKRISPAGDFKDIYRRSPAIFTYEPQQPPVLVHLLTRELPLDQIPFCEGNTPHSIVMLGKIEGEDACFEKKGGRKAGFVTVKSTEQYYNARVRLYVLPAS